MVGSIRIPPWSRGQAFAFDRYWHMSQFPDFPDADKFADLDCIESTIWTWQVSRRIVTSFFVDLWRSAFDFSSSTGMVLKRLKASKRESSEPGL